MIKLIKSWQGIWLSAIMTCAIPVLTGCQQLSQRYSVVRAPMVPSAPSPYSFPRGGAYSIADPMPDVSPFPRLPAPGYSIPLPPSRTSAPPPSSDPPLPSTDQQEPSLLPGSPPLNSSPVPPPPGDPVNSRSSNGNSVSARLKAMWDRSRNPQPLIQQSSVQRNANQNVADIPAPDRQSDSALSKPLPLAQLVPADSDSSNDNLTPGHSMGPLVLPPNAQADLLAPPASNRPTTSVSNNASLPTISPGLPDLSNRQTPIENWNSSPSFTSTVRGVPLRKQPALPVLNDIPTAGTVPATSLPQLQSTPAAVPVLLPPGA